MGASPLPGCSLPVCRHLGEAAWSWYGLCAHGSAPTCSWTLLLWLAQERAAARLLTQPALVLQGSEVSKSCSICLDTFSEGSMVTTLPCLHAFDTDCIDPWLQQNGNQAACPVCKEPVFGSRQDPESVRQ